MTINPSILDRLAILKKPKTGELCKPAKPSRNTQGKVHKPGRNIGKLNQLVKMPLDIIFEVKFNLQGFLQAAYLIFRSQLTLLLWRLFIFLASRSISALYLCLATLGSFGVLS